MARMIWLRLKHFADSRWGSFALAIGPVSLGTVVLAVVDPLSSVGFVFVVGVPLLLAWLLSPGQNLVQLVTINRARRGVWLMMSIGPIMALSAGSGSLAARLAYCVIAMSWGLMVGALAVRIFGRWWTTIEEYNRSRPKGWSPFD